jgi:hypothetical protein
LLLETVSCVHATGAQRWPVNFQDDRSLLLEPPYQLPVLLPVPSNHWPAMPGPDIAPSVFYDSATQSPTAFGDHEDFLTSVQLERQLKEGGNQQVTNQTLK